MAQRKLRIDHTDPTSVTWCDAVTNEKVLSCELPESVDNMSDCEKAVFRYGIAQIVADGGAVSADATFTEKLAGMKLRIAQIENGEYRLGQRGGLVDGTTFAAMVALGLIADDADNRAKWRDAKKSARDLVGRRADVRDWIAANVVIDEKAAESAVATIFDSAE